MELSSAAVEQAQREGLVIHRVAGTKTGVRGVHPTGNKGASAFVAFAYSVGQYTKIGRFASVDDAALAIARFSKTTAQPGALAAPQPLGGFGAKPAQPATPAAAGADDVELAAFSYGRLVTAVPGDASVRVVAPHEDQALRLGQ